MKHCPSCHRPINASAIVEAFNDPANWQFWGMEGHRWIVCKTDSFIHFRTNMDGRQQHRLAIIHGQAQEWIAAEKAAQSFNDSRNHSNLTNQDAYAKEDEWL